MINTLTRILHCTTTETLAADLSALGATPTDIAGTLAILGITGERRVAHDCPIANYLASKGHYEPVTGMLMIYAGKGENRVRIMPPEPIGQFLTKFDNGKYPELETK